MFASFWKDVPAPFGWEREDDDILARKGGVACESTFVYVWNCTIFFSEQKRGTAIFFLVVFRSSNQFARMLPFMPEVAFIELPPNFASFSKIIIRWLWF